ncbi:MAG: ISKra4 family transposase [Candidatus Latescibacterota bacterium]
MTDLDFEAAETSLKHRALRSAANLFETELNADTSDHTESQGPCTCGRMAVYAGRREKTFTTVLGPLTLCRAYYHCEPCGRGFCPRDRDLGLEGGSHSPGVLRMVGIVGATVSFEEGSELLKKLGAVEISPKQVEREAESLGREMAKDEQEVRAPEDLWELKPTTYLGMDGTAAPMRAEEVKGRKGKQADGSSKSREVKLCTFWTAEGRDENGIPVRDPGSVSYTAAIESAAEGPGDVPSDFAQRVQRESSRRHFGEATRRVILGDGAIWIWNLADTYFPDAIQIVDRFHAKQHLSDVSKLVYPGSAALATPWAHARHDELDCEKFEALYQALGTYADSIPEARQCIEYFRRNRDRMRYKTFHKRGLCTSTGVVEAGCKHAIGTRLKRPGMHWTLMGANAIIALRCCKLSGGRFESFWERRNLKEAA